MPYADPEKKRKKDRERYRANKNYYKKKYQRHRREHPALHAYWGQKHTSKQRGVEFKLTFQQWLDWWGTDIDLRGRRRHQLQMCRYDDVGAYEIGNIYKATQAENDAGPRPYPEITF